jgi:hypothetical protein
MIYRFSNEFGDATYVYVTLFYDSIPGMRSTKPTFLPRCRSGFREG